jgi:signal transduction histidine kinase
MSRRGCVGLLKVENKKPACADASSDVGFTHVDEQIAKLFAAKILLLLESCRTVDALRELLEAAEKAHDLDEMFDLILDCGLRLLDADRGDIAWWDEAKPGLVLRSTRSPCNLHSGEFVPEKSVMKTVWDENDGRIVEDVSSCPFYYRLDPNTKSEIAVPVRYEGRRVGVLNAESSKRSYFSVRDRDILELLGHHAAIAVKTYGRAAQFRERVRQLAELKSPTVKGLLQDVLHDLRSDHGFDAGLIYLPDYVNKRLNCTAWVGCDGREIDPKEFSYRFHENALATKVFREMKPYFSPDPRADSNVSPRGLDVFGIERPLLGLPLVFRGDPVGVLVLWSRTGPDPTLDSAVDAKPLALVAALASGVSSSAERHSIFAEDYAHSLESPLRAVSSLVGKVSRHAARGDLSGLNVWLPVLSREKDRLRRFADQARVYSRLIGRPSDRKVFSLKELVQSSLEIWQSEADERKMNFHAQLVGGQSIVFGNEDDLGEALANVFHNAVKFSAPGQTISVSLSECSEGATVTVEDEGPGVAPENAEAIWKPFTSMPVGSVPKGAGLGLAIAREIVLQHGGTMVYNPGRENKGACFRMTLPLFPAPGSTEAGGENA